MVMGVVEAIYKFKYFIFCRQKNTGKMARAQGKHREFGINWSMVTLEIVFPYSSEKNCLWHYLFLGFFLLQAKQTRFV